MTSSQPCLIFSIFFRKHGRNSTVLHIRTIIGRKTAIINVGGVYHINCFISTHLFQAKINACIVPSRRETIPRLLCKRKKNYLGEIHSIRAYFILPHLNVFCCLGILSFICDHFPITFLNNVYLHLSIRFTCPHFTPLLLGNVFVSQLTMLRKFTIIRLSVSANQEHCLTFIHIFLFISLMKFILCALSLVP